MNYPNKQDIITFSEILNKDGINVIFEYIAAESEKNIDIKNMLSYLAANINKLLKDELEDVAQGYVNGYISCLDIFRRKIETTELSLDDINLQLENLQGWIEFLENENFEMREKINELTGENKELRKMSALQKHGNNSNCP